MPAVTKKTKTLKKRQIMREGDYESLPKSVLDVYKVDFKILTKQYFERRSNFFYLKDKKYIGDQYALYDYPKEMIQKFSGIVLYDRRYSSWLIRYNEENELCIRAGLRQPESRLGLATFRKK
jgi:hypothetical protein